MFKKIKGGVTYFRNLGKYFLKKTFLNNLKGNYESESNFEMKF